MTTDAKPTPQRREPLTRDRVLEAAIALADDGGIGALTMRNLAHALDVEAMSLYYHVANKDALLDGVVDTLIGEIESELGGLGVVHGESDWQRLLRERIFTARTVMLRHPWAPAVIETRTAMSPTLVRYFDTLLGILIEGGFSYDLAHHTMHALGSRALGFNQELFAPENPAEPDDAASTMLAELAPQIPYLVAMLDEITHDDTESTLGWCDDQTEFTFGLDVLIEGLERRLENDRHRNRT